MSSQITTTNAITEIHVDGELVVITEKPLTEIVIAQGDAGPQGPQGLPGPSGTGDKNYTHNQSTPATTWNVAHNLGKFPAVTVLDSAGTEFQCEINYIDSNNLQVIVTAAFSGVAYCN